MWCRICGRTVDPPDHFNREDRVCECGGISRNLHIAKIICNLYRINQLSELNVKVLSFSLGLLARHIPNAIGSEYERIHSPPHVPAIQSSLHDLPFRDNEFDLVITEDVFEHVEDPWRGFKEIHRILRQQGHHVFTIPYYHYRATTYADNFAPEFHKGNNAPCKVFTKFGDDIIELLSQAGFTTDRHWSHPDELQDGITNNFVFASKKCT